MPPRRAGKVPGPPERPYGSVLRSCLYSLRKSERYRAARRERERISAACAGSDDELEDVVRADATVRDIHVVDGRAIAHVELAYRGRVLAEEPDLRAGA